MHDARAVIGFNESRPPMPCPTLPRYGLAVVAAVVAVLSRLALDPILAEGAPFATLEAAIVVVAAVAGRGPGLTTLGLGLLGVVYFVLEPSGELSVSDPSERAGVVLNLVIGVPVVFFCAWAARRPEGGGGTGRGRPDAPDKGEMDRLLRLQEEILRRMQNLPSAPPPPPAGEGQTAVRVAAPPPTRLMHLLAYAPKGTRAVDHLILEFARYARLVGWHVTFGFTGAPPEEFAEALARSGAEWFVFGHPFTWRAARELRRAFDGRRPELLQTSFFSAFELPILWLKVSGFARRLLVIDHSSGAGPPPTGPLALVRRVRGWLAGRVIDGVVPVSHFVARRAVERVFLPARKVHTIHNGIDLDRYPSPVRTPGGAVKIAYAGQLIPEKGVDTLLGAAERLREWGVGAVDVAIAGVGPRRAELERAAAAKGLVEVRFLGHVDAVHALFGWADVVVVPSLWAEAFGYVAIEAMACGAAVVVSDAGALPEVVGDVGLVFRAGEADDLADKLRLLINSPEERLRRGAAGRELVASEYRLLKRVIRHLALCAHVVAPTCWRWPSQPLPPPESPGPTGGS